MQWARPKTDSVRNLVGALFTLVLIGIACVIVWSVLRPIEPLNARKEATLHSLKELASQVNDYRQRTGALPDSLAQVAPATRGYRLLLGADEPSFIVLADHVFVDETGNRFQFGCDQELRILKQPPTRDGGKAESPLSSGDSQALIRIHGYT